MRSLPIVVVIFLSGLLLALADMGYYKDTIAVNENDLYLNLRTPPMMEIEIHTSSQYLAGTVDNVYATFSGDFSVSGPHLLGTFFTGTATTLSFSLDRVIGKLQRVIFSTDGTDGWLYSTVICRFQGVEYVLSGPKQWLVAFNPLSFREHGIATHKYTSHPIIEYMQPTPCSMLSLIQLIASIFNESIRRWICSSGQHFTSVRIIDTDSNTTNSHHTVISTAGNIPTTLPTNKYLNNPSQHWDAR